MKVIKYETTGLPVITNTEMKQHLRVSSDIDDNYIEMLIDTATSHIETITGKTLVSSVYHLFLENWPVDDVILPFPPVAEIVKVEYIDKNDNIYELGSDNYSLIQSFANADKLVFFEWPNVELNKTNPIAVIYNAGYESVPLELTQAVRFLVSHWYENREAFLSNHSFEVPFGVKHLLMNFREY